MSRAVATFTIWRRTEPAPPVKRPRRVVRRCEDCPTWLIGDSRRDAEARLAEHVRTCHG